MPAESAAETRIVPDCVMTPPSVKAFSLKVVPLISGPDSSAAGMAETVSTSAFAPSERLTAVTAKKYGVLFSRPVTLAESFCVVRVGVRPETELKSVSDTYTA